MKKVFLLMCLMATTVIASATDVWEGLPGTRFEHHIFSDQSSVEVYATPSMLASLKEYGLEVCGVGFTATKIWYGDGKDNIDENTAWSGFFWMDDWSTLEITKNCFAGVDWSKVKAIRFYSEAF